VLLPLVCCATAFPADPPCTAYEAAKTIDGSTFRFERPPWKVTAEVEGKVVVENTVKKTTCSITIPSVVAVYTGTGRQVYVRSVDITADVLYALNGDDCSQAAKPKSLGGGSIAESRRILKASGMCSDPSRTRK
jgi:hypothetical protein